MEIEEFSELTKRSPGHIRNLSYTGKLEVLPIRMGRRLLWDRAEVEAWLDRLMAERFTPDSAKSSAG